MFTRPVRPLFALALGVCCLLPAVGLRAAEEEMVENPAYKSWSALKVGSAVTLTNDTTVGPQKIKAEMIQKLVEMTPEKAVIELTMKVDMAGAPQPPARKQDIPAKVKKSEATPGKLPEGMKGESKDLGTAKLDIAGKSYDCKVFEFTGEQNGIKFKGKSWTSDKIPGGLAKLESSGKIGDQEMKSTMAVTKIESK